LAESVVDDEHRYMSTQVAHLHDSVSEGEGTEPPTVPIREPIVDVGIPTLGNSRYLAESIESVLAQSLPDWRLVVSENGAGKDSVRELMEPYLRDPRVRHVVRGKTVGRGTNHNLLIDAGSAPYVGLLHDDDRWHPEFLERRVRFLEEYPTCGFVFSGHVVIDGEGAPIGRTRLRLSPGVHKSAKILPALYRDNFIGCPTVLVRRTAYETVGVGYPDILNYDLPMWLRLTSKFDVGSLAEWDADYRLHAAQASANRTRLAEEQLLVLQTVSDLDVPASVRRVAHAETQIRCALDAVERGDRRLALACIARALHADPLSIARPSVVTRMLAALAALAGGERGRRTLAAQRERRWHSGGAEGLLPVTDDTAG
jgi:teichuronic acid biosynthesis glycosyltransferase TuaG